MTRKEGRAASYRVGGRATVESNRIELKTDGKEKTGEQKRREEKGASTVDRLVEVGGCRCGCGFGSGLCLR